MSPNIIKINNEKSPEKWGYRADENCSVISQYGRTIKALMKTAQTRNRKAQNKLIGISKEQRKKYFIKEHEIRKTQEQRRHHKKHSKGNRTKKEENWGEIK